MAQEDAPIGDGVTIVPSIRTTTKGNERQRTISLFYKPVGEEQQRAEYREEEMKRMEREASMKRPPGRPKKPLHLVPMRGIPPPKPTNRLGGGGGGH